MKNLYAILSSSGLFISALFGRILLALLFFSIALKPELMSAQCLSPVPVFSSQKASFYAGLQSGLTYDFEDVTVEAGGVTVESWCWDFGDGDYSTLQNPTHTYDEAGTYEVCLTIIDSKGCMDESCMTIVAEQACDCDDADFLYINGEQTWDATTVLGNHLIVPAGSRLIVDGATLLIGKGCKIFVERGARLDIINESTLTSGCDTGRWGGIEVWGNGALAHPSGTSGITGGTYPGSNNEHGVVYINNGSTLSKAVIAYSATIKKCTLSNSLTGIEANYTPDAMMPYDLLIGDPEVSADGNTLDELSYGVVARSAPNLVMGNNDFSTVLVGLYILGASGYNIKANDFTDYWYGVVVNQTANTFTGNLVCNTYSSILYDGLLAWGNNNNLQFKQETFDLEDSRDVRLLQQTDGTFGSINGAQGQIDNPVFNLFSGDDHITADLFSTQQFFYYPPGPNITSTYPDLVPRCDLLLTNCSGGAPNNFYNDFQQESLSDYDDGCLDLPGVGDLAPEAPCMSLGCLDTLNTEISTRRALIDDGDTAGLLYAIANDANGTQTFNDLRTASPYLSNEVLEALLESGMTTGKKDSLAKINAPLAFILMVLAESELSAPAYAHIEYLRESEGVSAMEILQSELSDLERRRTGAIDAMVKDHLSKLEIGAADTLLMNEGEIKKRIGLKLYTSDLEAAQTLLNTLPADDYRAVQQINIDRLDEGNNYELESADAEDLEEIAARVSPEAAYAQALLILLRGDTFALQMPEEEESLVRPHLPWVQSVLSAAVLKVQPNPTPGQIEIILPTATAAFEYQNGRLELYDLKGQLIRVASFSGPSTTWQIGELPDGVYLIRYIGRTTSLTAKVIIQH
jgi:PKD repeat protein